MSTDFHGPGAGVANVVSGAVSELAKQGSAPWAQNFASSGAANKAGHKLVAGASKYAPHTVAAVAGVVAAAPVLAVAVGAGALAGGIYFGGKWLREKFG